MNKLCNDCGVVELRYNNKSGFCRGCYERNRPRAQFGSEAWHAERSRRQKYYQDNVDRMRFRARQYRFGVSSERFDDMVESQHGRCAICKRTPEEFGGVFHIDHDHTCCSDSREKRTCGNCVRALLCKDCNQGLGRFNDNVDRLLSAVDYLKRFTPNN